MTWDQAEAKRVAWGTDERRERAASKERESILPDFQSRDERVKDEDNRREGKATKRLQRGVETSSGPRRASEEDGAPTTSQLRVCSNGRGVGIDGKWAVRM